MLAFGLYRRSGGWVRAFIAIGLTFSLTAALIGFSGKNPIVAYEAMFRGAFGSLDRAAFALNKATPYIISGIGVALCFRAGIINIGAEGQIALGGLAATWVALTWPQASAPIGIPLAFVAGMSAGALWSGIAAAIHVGRGVNEVLTTLLLNFVALLLVGEALHGNLGEAGAGFPQSPLVEPNYWLSTIIPGSQLHSGVLIGPLVAIGGYVLLRYTTVGFAIRVMGASRSAASYAGFTVPWLTIQLMLMAGGLAGLAGAVEVLGIHYRLIEGFSTGFGFNAVVVALLGALHPLAIVPAGLFFGFLEAGALSMQREIGVPSSLVAVIQGLTMLFVLAALTSSRRSA
jgi:general nucleoside transport system permease protein